MNLGLHLEQEWCYYNLLPTGIGYTRAMFSLAAKPAIATWRGTFSFFIPGILGMLGIFGMLENQPALVLELAGAGTASC